MENKDKIKFSKKPRLLKSMIKMNSSIKLQID